MKLNKKGFTLIELMIVIVIIGILAAVAIPRFTMASHKAKASEFPTVLTQIYTAEQTYETENGVYTATLADIGVSIPNSQWFTYSVENASDKSKAEARATVKKDFGDATTSDYGNIVLSTGAKSATTNLAKYAPNWK